jgi:GR25 family glycosyltransferase involved in LPS biosynthesis
MKVFVIHYRKLVERKKRMLEQFRKYTITDYEFIEIDRDELYMQNTSIFEEGYDKAQIAIALSHFYAFYEIAKKYTYALVLEDDAELCDDFIKKLDIYKSQIPETYDMVYIGDGCKLHIPSDMITENEYIYRKGLEHTSWGGYGSARCTDSYLMSKTCAIKLCNYINNIHYKINVAVDVWINIAALHTNMEVYWAEPTIVTQGTQNGMYDPSH